MCTAKPGSLKRTRKKERATRARWSKVRVFSSSGGTRQRIWVA